MKKISTLLFAFALITTWPATAQTLHFVKTMGPANFSANIGIGRALMVDQHKNIILTGGFYNPCDFDPGPGVNTLTNIGTGSSPWDIYFAKYDSLGNHLWSKNFSSLNGDHMHCNTLDKNGNIYGVCRFHFTCDFDPGPGTFNVTSYGANDIGLFKLDPSGNLLWVNQLGGNSGDMSYTIAFNADSNLVITGYYTNTADFDPGAATVNKNSLTDGPNFFATYSPSGNFVSVNTFFGEMVISFMRPDGNGDLICTGTFRGTNIDVDPGAGTYLASSRKAGIYDVFLMKTDPYGNLIWFKTMTSSQHLNSGGLAIDGNNNIYASGSYRDTLYADPSNLADYVYMAGMDYDFFGAKWDAAGNLQWKKTFGNTNSNQGLAVSVDRLGYPMFYSHFLGTIDFDPGPTTYNMSSHPTAYNGFIQKLSPAGDFIFVRNMGSTIANVVADEDNNLLVYGDYWTSYIDMDPGAPVLAPATAPSGIYFSKWKQDSCAYVPLYLLLDSIADVTCSNPNGYVHCTVSGGVSPLMLKWDGQPFDTSTSYLPMQNGIHTVTLKDAMNCEATLNYLVNGVDYPTDFDLNVDMVFTPSSFVPGGMISLDAQCINLGCVPVNGMLYLVTDSLLNYNSASIVPDYISGDTIAWSFSSLIYDSTLFIPDVIYQIPTYATSGYEIGFHLFATPVAGDTVPTNNSMYIEYNLVAPFDPNDKQVYPQGANANHGILNNQTMTYTVRFQNTGTAEAINVYIKDSLDINLDLASVRVVSSSHTCITEILPGSVLKFRFDNIHLPDSTSNEPESHGYVMYEIDQLPDLPHNTVIENTAAIYFNYNEPVITNTVFNTIDQGGAVQVINDHYCPGDSSTLIIVPNVPGFNGNWEWFEGSCSGTVAGTGSSIVVSPANTTTYFVKESAGSICYSNTVHVLPTYSLTESEAICSSDSVFFGGSYVHTPGLYTHVFASVHGCDSTVNLNLSHLPSFSTNPTISICSSDSVLFGGSYIHNTGLYTHVFPSVYGCDSTVNLNLLHLPNFNTHSTADICSYDSLFFGSSFIHAPGTYSFVFTSMTGCDSTVTLTLSNQSIDIAVTPSGIDLTASATPASYQWINCATMAPISGETSQTYTATANGNYAVIIEQNGCTDTSACYLVTSVGMANMFNGNHISIYPNPVSNELNIVFEKAMHADITLTDVTGKTILRQTSNNQTIKLQTAYLETGVYVLTITTGNEKKVAKIIKQ